MPIFRSFLRVRLVWHLRAVALRCCQCWISPAAASISAAHTLPLSQQLCTNAAAAICTWHTVRSGFFPPQLLANPGQEQVAHRGEDQVPFQSQPAAAFPHHGPFLTVLDAVSHPRLVPQFRRVLEHVLHADRRSAAGEQSRCLAAASFAAPKRSAGTPRRLGCPPHGNDHGRPTTLPAETVRRPTGNGNPPWRTPSEPSRCSSPFCRRCRTIAAARPESCRLASRRWFRR